jgi:hypothetical protein
MQFSAIDHICNAQNKKDEVIVLYVPSFDTVENDGLITDNFCILGCDAMWSSRNIPKFAYLLVPNPILDL